MRACSLLTLTLTQVGWNLLLQERHSIALLDLSSSLNLFKSRVNLSQLLQIHSVLPNSYLLEAVEADCTAVY